jgi:fibronectin-binding autotransporter adhesin
MKFKFRPRFPASAFPLAIVLACGGSALADNVWDGEGSSPFDWSDATNWGADTSPSYGTLTFSGTNGTTNTVDANTSMNMLVWTGTSAWTLNNSGAAIVSLYDDGGIQAKIENQSSGLVTINAPIDFAATAGTNRGEINAVNGDITFGAGGTINVSGSAVNELHFYGSGHTVTIDSVLTAGARKLVIGPTVADNNTVILNAANSYSGNTEVNVGTVQIGNNTALGTSAVFLGNGGATYANLNSSLLLNTSGLTVTNAITTNKADTGSGLGSGTRTIGGNFTSGNSTFSGLLTLNGGAVLTAGNGGTVTYSGNIVNGSDTGNVSRALKINAAGGTVVLSNASNSYSGGTSIDAGTLSFANGALGTAGAVTMNGGTLQWSTGNTQDLSSRITLAAAKTATFDTNGNAVTLGTTLGGGTIAASIAKTGAGVLTLSGTNTYTGTTAVNVGTLKLGSAAALGSSSLVTVSPGATLDTAGFATARPITISGTGVSGNALYNSVAATSGPV